MRGREGRWAQAAGLALLLAAGTAAAFDWDNYRVEDFEERAGAASLFEASPGDGVFGLGIGDGTWLKGTPVFGDYSVAFFWNGIEEALYAGVGMTLRLMPHWSVAPFVGAGGSYNQILSSGGGEEAAATAGAEPRAESYWGGHAEAGVRVRGGARFYEILGRHVWSSAAAEDADYWSIRFAVGFPAQAPGDAGL